MADEPLDTADRELVRERRKARYETAWYVVLAVVCGVLVLSAAVAGASVSPAFCGSCHAASHKALAASAHEGIPCDGCHLQRGALGAIENRLGIVSMVLAAPVSSLGPKRVTGGSTDNESCVRCHKEMISRTVTVGRIRMSHRAPQEKGYLCVECHAGAGHPQKGRPTGSYSMDDCLECHAVGTNNLAACDTCHVEGTKRSDRTKTAWQVTHGANWRSAHGMGNLKTCTSCHGENYCVTCHGMRLPHPDGFLQRHGKEVKARPTGSTDCLQCHKGSACEDCHGIEMPHPISFSKGHKQDVKKLGKPLCERCHAKSSCDSCHTRHTHPGIPTDQLKMLKERPVTP